MHFKPLGGNKYDVFVGNGWDNWTRIQREHDGSITFVAGNPISEDVRGYLVKRLEAYRKPHNGKGVK